MKLRFLFLILTFGWALSVRSQDRCGFDIIHQKRMNTDPVYKAGIEEEKVRIRKYVNEHKNDLLNRPTAVLYTIPVVVHVVHTGGAVGTTYNPSVAQIQSAINYLNQVFEGSLPAIEGVGEIQINFALAARDPNCNPSSGITRTDGSGITDYTTLGVNVNNTNGVNESAIKNLIRWDPYRYYNIWLVNRIDGSDGTSGSFIGGFAYFPGSPSTLDGTIMLATQMNTNRKTLSHEMGHAFSLYHPFEGASGATCPANADCSIDGDEICDTDPITQPAGFVCRTGINACTGMPYSINTEHNFMNYTSCATLFTADQKLKMLAAAAGPFRSGLTTSWARSSTYPVLPFTPPIAAACTPVTSASGTASNIAGNINFLIANRNLSSGNSRSDNGYFNGAAGCLNLVELIRGNAYSFTLSPYGQNYEQLRVWIDYNNNGIFENASEEVFYQNNIGPPSRYNISVNGNLTVPLTAVTNTVLRMRVIEELGTTHNIAYNITSSCYNPVYGQAEDFPVIIYANSVLPVTYSSFSTLADGADAILHWRTETEKDNAKFMIERSNDGIHFREAGMVKGLNAMQGAVYQFRDRQPGEGIFYYRLKQVDTDGSFSYSAIVKVNITLSGNRNITLLSNLVDQEIRIRFNQHSGRSNTSIRLMDMSGRILLSKQFRPESGDLYKVDISGLGLSTGIYFLEISHGAEKWIEKVMKR
jgi:Pregnancy-associated plasma protein-A/GEVED domain/Secretion system C-terminal sorting domain